MDIIQGNGGKVNSNACKNRVFQTKPSILYCKFQFIGLFTVQHCRGRRLRRPGKTLQNLDKRDVQGAVPYKLRFNHL